MIAIFIHVKLAGYMTQLSLNGHAFASLVLTLHTSCPNNHETEQLPLDRAIGSQSYRGSPQRLFRPRSFSSSLFGNDQTMDHVLISITPPTKAVRLTTTS